MNDRAVSSNNDYDLVIIGSGAASFAGAIRAAEMGKRVAMVERGTVGGTCVNYGCVPSKTLIRAAEARQKILRPNFKAVTGGTAPLDFKELIRQKDELVRGLRQAKYQNVLESYNIDFIAGEASFVSPHEIIAGNHRLRAAFFLIATGGSPHIPAISGLREVDFLTSTSAFELRQLPSSIVIIGGRYIALEVAQMFQRLGSQVTVLQRSARILPSEDPDLTEELAGYLRAEGVNIITGVTCGRISQAGEFNVSFTKAGKQQEVRAEQLIVATGRRANTSGLNLKAAEVELNPDGTIITNDYNQSTSGHIYAAGDVIGNPAFVYTAAAEGRLAVENAFRGNKERRDYGVLPYVVFTDPQVARVGLNELTAAERGIEVECASLSLNNVPRAIAARDTRGFIKLLKKKGEDYLVGASILSPEGGELLMEVSLAIKYKIPLRDLSAMFHPYLTLSEAIKLTIQTFDKDVKKLSCCAS